LKTVQMDEVPKCQFCDDPAEYDSNTVFGSWAYLCEKHQREYGRPPTTKLEKRVKIAYKTDKVPTVNVPLTLDSVATVRCPHCNEPKSVEPDASYTATCESCGNRFKLIPQI